MTYLAQKSNILFRALLIRILFAHYPKNVVFVILFSYGKFVTWDIFFGGAKSVQVTNLS